MNRRNLALVLLIPFTALTVYAITQVGFIGIWEQLFAGPAAWQIGVDLVVALVLVLTWLFEDARARGRNPWPWLAMTLCLGSFGPLLYLATRRSRHRVSAVTASSA